MADWRFVPEASTPTRVMMVDLDSFRALVRPREGRMTIERMKQLQAMAAKIQKNSPAGSDAGVLAGIVAEVLDAASTGIVGQGQTRITIGDKSLLSDRSLFELVFGGRW